jgi:predicted alpha-1,6-mannanase (GH76 family)
MEKMKTLLMLAAAVSFGSCLKQHIDDSPALSGGSTTGTYNWSGIADTAELSLDYFWSPSGKFYLSSNTSSDWAQYWPQAHALDVLTDAYLRNPSSAGKTRMTDLLTGVRAKNGGSWTDYFYDDEEWMALACLRAFAATGDNAFKAVTDELWADIKSGWSSDLGGGIWWRKDNPSKNTPSNMPAAILAARLYKIDGNSADLQWAQKIYDWERATLYDPNSGLVYDNIDKNGVKNTDWKFTYNQGTFIGAGLELYEHTGSSAYLSDALQAADFTLNSGFLTSGGILKDEGGGDGGLFKGIFVRYFTRLIVDAAFDPSKKSDYVNFLRVNGESLWSKGTNKGNLLFGSAWDKAPGGSTDLTVQLSGIKLVEALAELKKGQLF